MTQPQTTADYYQPPEWAPHRACWLAWPSHADLWKESLKDAQKEFTALCKEITALPSSTAPREGLEILVLNEAGKEAAKASLGDIPARYHIIPFGDIWLRDTGPIFLRRSLTQTLTAGCFKFNGWGGKYNLPGDAELSLQIAQTADIPIINFPWILEGGSVDVDGEGTCLTTRQCLLNPNRNHEFDETRMEYHLRQALGVQKVLWLNRGLINDHTDGHIDTLARFIAPATVVCMKPTDSDPNREALEEIRSDLNDFTDAKGRRLDVVEVPSPGEVKSSEGQLLPASYLNFYIGNHVVVVPTYGSRNDTGAVAALARHFPNHRVVGCSAKAILEGGGAFHCITQQEPLENEF